MAFVSGTAHVREYHRWMSFIDGENFTVRGQEIARQEGFKLTEGESYCKDTFLWVPGHHAHSHAVYGLDTTFRLRPVRSIYYTSVVGDEEKIKDVTHKLWDLKFQPSVFKKNKGQHHAKGVDIALTKDVLSHAFFDNYDAAVLVAGDGDYMPLVEEVKRMGKVVYLVFFKQSGLNDNLKLACDYFYDMTKVFVSNWTSARP